MFKIFNSAGAPVLDEMTLLYHAVHEQRVAKKGTIVKVPIVSVAPLIAVTEGAAELLRTYDGFHFIKVHFDNTNFLVITHNPPPRPGEGLRIKNATGETIVDSSYPIMRKHEIVNIRTWQLNGAAGQNVTTDDGKFTYKASTGLIEANYMQVPSGALINYGSTATYAKYLNSTEYYTMYVAGVIGKRVVFLPKMAPYTQWSHPMSNGAATLVLNGALGVCDI